MSLPDFEEPDVEQARISAEAIALMEGYRKMPQPIFAVVDGAKFGYLPQLLDDQELKYKSLFLDHGDADVEAAAGWLVSVDSEEKMAALLELSDAANSLVLWSCPLGEDVLHRHLRSINLVIIPDDEPEPDGGLAADGQNNLPSGLKDQTVLFRHYDPNVIGSLLRIFDEMQFARFFGPATQIAWYAADFGGRRRAVRPDELPVPPRGPLRISAEQIAELQELRTSSSQQKISKYLRQVAPKETAGMTDQELARFIGEKQREGRELGLVSERADALWAYLQLTSRGRMGRDPALRDMFLYHPELGTSDDKLFMLMKRLGSE